MFIEVPGCADPAWDLRRAIERNRRLKDDWMLGERARRLIIFGNDGLGNEFGWDPLEATDPSAPEFAIFALYRRAEEATRLADTFRGFIDLCLELGHYRREEFEGEPAGGGPGVGSVFQRARPCPEDDAMYDDRLLRDFGLMPGAEPAPAGKVRSTLKWHNAIFQVVMTVLLVGGIAALGLWFAIGGIRGWGTQPDAPLLLAASPAMLGLAALLAYHGAGDVNLWVEVDGDVIRARHLYSLRVTTRRVGEIEEVRTLAFAAGGATALAVESLVGRVRGVEIRFGGGGRGLRVFRPEMSGVWELIAAIYWAMGREGEIAPEVERFEGRPWIARVTWADRSPHRGAPSRPQE